MANYPAPPGPRMALDLDGSVLVETTYVGGHTVLDGTAMQAVNDESSTAYVTTVNNYTGLAWVFPELRDVVGVFFCASGDMTILPNTRFFFEYSTNTTNGVDGTWTLFTGTPEADLKRYSPWYRTEISACSLSAVKAVRVSVDRTSTANNNHTFVSFHLYGTISAGQNPDRLALWHPSSNVVLPAASLDWGDVPRSSNATLTFRVKNLSATKTANSVSVGMSALTDGVPAASGWHQLSPDGSSWSGSAAVGTLAPGAISSVVSLRRQVPANAQLSAFTHRLTAQATSWS